MNYILHWVIDHVQPVTSWNISILWVPLIVSLTSLASYFYWYPDTAFTNDVSAQLFRLFDLHTRFQVWIDQYCFGIYGKILYYLCLITLPNTLSTGLQLKTSNSVGYNWKESRIS